MARPPSAGEDHGTYSSAFAVMQKARENFFSRESVSPAEIDRMLDTVIVDLNHALLTDAFGVTTLMVTARYGSLKSLERILKLSPSSFVSKFDSCGRTALHWGVAGPYEEGMGGLIMSKMRKLVQAGSDINQSSSDGLTPLHIIAGAVPKGGDRTASELLDFAVSELGANVNVEDCTGQTPLAKAVQSSSRFCVVTLQQFGAFQKIKKPDVFGRSVLDLAAQDRKPEAVLRSIRIGCHFGIGPVGSDPASNLKFYYPCFKKLEGRPPRKLGLEPLPAGGEAQE